MKFENVKNQHTDAKPPASTGEKRTVTRFPVADMLLDAAKRSNGRGPPQEMVPRAREEVRLLVSEGNSLPDDGKANELYALAHRLASDFNQPDLQEHAMSNAFMRAGYK